MEYSNYCKPKVLAQGSYRDILFCVVSYGTHPCCYVDIPKTHPLYKTDYFDAGISCHGGLTYGKSEKEFVKVVKDFKMRQNGYVFGWDYAHIDDYYISLLPHTDNKLKESKKWTTEEMLQEVDRVIYQLRLDTWREVYR